MGGDRLSAAALAVGVALIVVAVYFFLLSISLLMPEVYAVISGLTSLAIGFAMLGSGVSLIRSYVIVRAARRAMEESRLGETQR